ncbi:MAG TPA: type I methionyl aminopeptidase [Candidatus Acidoferrales bacterium]|jgi:methionyl aminopeptidase|nr:type I methionyl aminopeptidase [Candidatus Acidoferrales bacterium]
MSIQDYAELLAFKEVGRIVQLAIAAMANSIRPGISTRELADIGGKVMRQNGARSAPALVYGFPGDVLISLNDEAVHGIPSESRKVRAGDLVKLDVTFEKNGYMADAAITVPVEPVSEDARRLAVCAERAFQKAMQFARSNHRVNEIGRAIEKEVRASGFRVIRELGGHGIGRTIHESPSVPNYDDGVARGRLTPGLVLTVEPIIAMGSARPMNAGDGWTVKTADGGLSAHYEHTLVITDGAPILLTAA